MPRKGDRWSKRETRKLKNKWPDHTAEEIAGMLPGRTVEAVESKAQRLNEKGELPDKNRSRSKSRSSYSTSQKQVEKGGSQVKSVSGEIEQVKTEVPRDLAGDRTGIGLKINGDWYYDTWSPSRFEETGKGIAFQEYGFTVNGARLSGADYTVEDSGSGRGYNRLQSYGTIQKANATELTPAHLRRTEKFLDRNPPNTVRNDITEIQQGLQELDRTDLKYSWSSSSASGTTFKVYHDEETGNFAVSFPPWGTAETVEDPKGLIYVLSAKINKPVIHLNTWDGTLIAVPSGEVYDVNGEVVEGTGNHRDELRKKAVVLDSKTGARTVESAYDYMEE